MTCMVKAYGKARLPNVRTGERRALLCRLPKLRCNCVASLPRRSCSWLTRWMPTHCSVLLKFEGLHLLIESPPRDRSKRIRISLKDKTTQSPLYTRCVLQTKNLRPSKEKTISPTPCVLRSKKLQSPLHKCAAPFYASWDIFLVSHMQCMKSSEKW
jgi:hypothetical protein